MAHSTFSVPLAIAKHTLKAPLADHLAHGLGECPLADITGARVIVLMASSVIFETARLNVKRWRALAPSQTAARSTSRADDS